MDDKTVDIQSQYIIEFLSRLTKQSSGETYYSSGNQLRLSAHDSIESRHTSDVLISSKQVRNAVKEKITTFKYHGWIVDVQYL